MIKNVHQKSSHILGKIVEFPSHVLWKFVKDLGRSLKILATEEKIFDDSARK